jgi:hypothetical protein
VYDEDVLLYPRMFFGLFSLKKQRVSIEAGVSRANDGEYFADAFLRRSAWEVSDAIVVQFHDIRAISVWTQSVSKEVSNFDNQLGEYIRIGVSNLIISEPRQDTRNSGRLFSPERRNLAALYLSGNSVSAPPRSGYEHIDLPAAAAGADQPGAPIEHRACRAVPLGHLAGVGLDLVLTVLAPNDQPDAGGGALPSVIGVDGGFGVVGC